MSDASNAWYQMPFLEMQNSKKIPKAIYYSPWFFQKMAPKPYQIFITLSDTYIDVLMLCRKFELFLTNNFRLLKI